MKSNNPGVKRKIASVAKHWYDDYYVVHGYMEKKFENSSGINIKEKKIFISKMKFADL